MAAEDLTREGLNSQKRDISIAVSEILTGTQIGTDGCTVFKLPEKVFITRAYMINTVAAGASDTIDITFGGTVITNEIDAVTLGMQVGTAVVTLSAYSDTGGDIVVKDGSAAVTTAYRGRCVVEYIELEKTTGAYTNMTV